MTSLELRPLLPSLQEKARKEINEEHNRIASDITAVREWLEKQPHLKSVNPSDQWLVAFLRGNKYSIEKTKSKLDMYYTLRTVVPEIFNNRNPFDPIVQGILKLGTYLPLTVLEAEDSRRVCLQRLKDAENSNYRLIDLLKEQIVDLHSVGMRTFSQWTPAVAKMSMTLTEKALPVRVKGCHLLRTSTAFETAYSVLRMVMSEKLKKRFNVYSQNFEAIYEVIPRTILPKEYGGECGTIQELTDYWKAKVESYSEWFQREELMCSDEALRPGAPKTSSDLFGAVGSFRKLEVD